ncbi:MAG: glycosyltransferase family 2 protein [Nitrospirae bacterium]|nr:glycosyltransferase family 2 protein [Nitrospirota bacterium]
METPFVSIVIPCRNEEKFIGKCLDSIVENDYPENKLEVLVVDGNSNDGTKMLLKKYAEQYPFVKILTNDKRITPVAMNLGIKAARGKYIMILGSHSEVQKNFIKENINAFNKYDVDCVGGNIITLWANENLTAKSIAMGISHPFGVGNVYFRIGSKTPRLVDAVPFGCYRREVFEKIGFFDEDLIRNQDDEFNLRLIKNGGKILLVPEVVSYYYARDSLKKLWKMYYQYGYFKPLVAKKIGAVLTWRQLIPAAFVSSLIFFGLFSLFFKSFLLIFLPIILSYLFVNIGFSFMTAVKKGFKYCFTLPVVFGVLHFSYGLGYLKGIWDFILLKKHKRKALREISLSR